MTWNHRDDGGWSPSTLKRREDGEWVPIGGEAGDMPGETIFHSPLDSQEEIDRFHIIDNSYNIDTASDPSGEDRDVLRMFCEQDQARGGGVSWAPNEDRGGGHTGENDPDAVYARYHVYFPEDTQLYRTDAGNGTKVPGVSGLYDENGAGGGYPADGRNWSARMFTRPTEESTDNTQFDLKYYVYHPDLSGDYGKLYDCDGSYDYGKWHEVTTYVQMNTPGEHDAILRGWVNGEQVFNREDFLFRDEDNPQVGVTRAYAAYIYWGGEWGPPEDQYVYFKDFTLNVAT